MLFLFKSGSLGIRPEVHSRVLSWMLQVPGVFSGIIPGVLSRILILPRFHPGIFSEVPPGVLPEIPQVVLSWIPSGVHLGISQWVHPKISPRNPLEVRLRLREYLWDSFRDFPRCFSTNSYRYFSRNSFRVSSRSLEDSSKEVPVGMSPVFSFRSSI